MMHLLFFALLGSKFAAASGGSKSQSEVGTQEATQSDDATAGTPAPGEFTSPDSSVKVKGTVKREGKNITIQNFEYVGDKPDVNFYVGTCGKANIETSYQWAARASVEPNDFPGLTFANNSGHQAFPALMEAKNKKINVQLPSNVQADDVVWVSVWCFKFGTNFGSALVKTGNVDCPVGNCTMKSLCGKAEGMCEADRGCDDPLKCASGEKMCSPDNAFQICDKRNKITEMDEKKKECVKEIATGNTLSCKYDEVNKKCKLEYDNEKTYKKLDWVWFKESIYECEGPAGCNPGGIAIQTGGLTTYWKEINPKQTSWKVIAAVVGGGILAVTLVGVAFWMRSKHSNDGTDEEQEDEDEEDDDGWSN